MTKSLPISKRMVWESYQKVVSKNGGAGIDGQEISSFKEHMAANLYKLWNRLSSGSYFPPAVRTVLIPKKQGGTRRLGIPTVSDRIAQGVVKDYLEPKMEAIFHDSSYGYRSGKSAHEALTQCQRHCQQYEWVIDVDIKGFFDNINHEIMMALLGRHTQDRWILMYVDRWLKAGVEQADGSLVKRTKGTPQGGVISPLLANLYLHHAFDEWMTSNHATKPFERYADDIVIHCNSKEEAEQLMAELTQRMSEFSLTLHPEKTKIVYCKNYTRRGCHDHESFTFLGYSFQPRTIRSKFDKTKRIIVYQCAISTQAKASIRKKLREVVRIRMSDISLSDFAQRLNPKIRGWWNYYTKFRKRETIQVFYYLNGLIRKWIKNTYKIIGKGKLYNKYRAVLAENPKMFYHWQQGITA